MSLRVLGVLVSVCLFLVSFHLCSFIIHPCSVTWGVSFLFGGVVVLRCLFPPLFYCFHFLFCCLTCLNSVVAWPRNRSNHREPQPDVLFWCSFAFCWLQCWFHITTCFCQLDNKENENMEKERPTKKTYGLVIYLIWEGFVLWSIINFYNVICCFWSTYLFCFGFDF